jgi:hypothetical protein
MTIEGKAELVEAIRERDSIIEKIRAVEASLAPMIEEMWEASKRVEDLANRARPEF